MDSRIDFDIDIERTLSGIPLFVGLDHSDRTTIAQQSALRRLDRGAAVFREGDRPQAMYYLVAGQIKRSFCSPDGDEKVLNVYRPGQTFGEVELFNERLYMSRTEATVESRILQISQRIIAELVSANSLIAGRMLKAVSNRHYELERDLVARRFNSSADRILDYFCELASDHNDGDTATLHLTVSKQVLASHLDMTPETLSRTLRRLIDEELVDVRGRLVQLNLRAVAQRAASRTVVPSGSPASRPTVSAFIQGR